MTREISWNNEVPASEQGQLDWNWSLTWQQLPIAVNFFFSCFFERSVSWAQLWLWLWLLGCVAQWLRLAVSRAQIYISCCSDHKIICLIPLVCQGYVRTLKCQTSAQCPLRMLMIISTAWSRRGIRVPWSTAKLLPIRGALSAPWGVLSTPDKTTPCIKLRKSNVLFCFHPHFSTLFSLFFSTLRIFMAQFVPCLSHLCARSGILIYAYYIYICICLMNF